MVGYEEEAAAAAGVEVAVVVLVDGVVAEMEAETAAPRVEAVPHFLVRN